MVAVRHAGRGRLLSMMTAVMVLAALLLSAVPASAQAPTAVGDPMVQHEMLVQGLRDPTALEVTPDGRVIWAEREGRVMVWKQTTEIVQAAKLPVDAYDRSQRPGGQYGEGLECPRGDECPTAFTMAEGGIHGLLLSPDFDKTGHLYLYYTVVGSLGKAPNPPKMPGARGPQSTEGLFRLSRFTMRGDTLDLSSEVPLFENPAEWFHCCHYGGDLEWLSDGTLVMTVGDDTISDLSQGYSPHDPRPGMEYNNAVATSQNLADRRGKVLRIDVRDVNGDGSMVPKGTLKANPFADNPDADPYVYALGFRSNYRMAVDPDTDALFVATVGPDGGFANPTRGPAAHEEIEVVPPGGGTNHGWPYCIADNLPYWEYDFEINQSTKPFDCSGMTPASIYYTYGPERQARGGAAADTSPYVITGSGANTAMVGVVYDRPATGALRLPATYDNQLLWMEFNRDYIFRSPVNADGTLDNDPHDIVPVIVPETPRQFGTGLPSLRGPIDAATGPDGALYLVEYGTGTWNNTNGRISRIKCALCLPNPLDYGGAPVVDPSATVTAAGVATDAAAVMENRGLWALAVLAVLSTAGVVRRRRSVV
jgi:aldose sugar dehydrogenase